MASFKNETLTPRFKKMNDVRHVCRESLKFITSIVTRCIKGGVNRVHQVGGRVLSVYLVVGECIVSIFHCLLPNYD